jgi:hypothetical protein
MSNTPAVLAKGGPATTAPSTSDDAGQPPRPADVLGRYIEDYLDEGKAGPRYVLRHLRETRDAFSALRRLPVLPMALSGSSEAEMIRRSLIRKGGIGGLPLVRETVDVLVVPADAAEYQVGADKQTLRRKVRYAQKAGVTWSEVNDLDERRELLRLADEQERIHPIEEYRGVPDNSDLPDYRLWLVARAADGRPLMLSVTPYDGEWALLRHFRTLGTGREYSDTRYLMTQVLVEQLSSRGVRYLANHAVPFDLPKGLRHFQKMVGWEIVRVRLSGIRVASTSSRHRAEAGTTS